jgi:hypothetical protein
MLTLRKAKSKKFLSFLGVVWFPFFHAQLATDILCKDVGCYDTETLVNWKIAKIKIWLLNFFLLLSDKICLYVTDMHECIPLYFTLVIALFYFFSALYCL